MHLLSFGLDKFDASLNGLFTVIAKRTIPGWLIESEPAIES